MRFFSIIVPTIGDSPKVAETLIALAHQVELEPNSEIIVVDNRRDPESRDFDLKQLCRDINDEIRYIHEPGIGLTRARHTGIARARGDVIALIDDDVIIGDGWLNSALSIFANDRIVLAGGPSSPLFASKPPKWLDAFFIRVHTEGSMCTWLSLLDLHKKEGLIDPNFVWGLNFIIRKEAVLELGGFHPDLVPVRFQAWQGDGETGLTRKFAARGGLAWYSEHLRVFHQVPESRLTYKYMEKRAFYDGVCLSFTQARKQLITSVLIPAPRARFLSYSRQMYRLLIQTLRNPIGSWYLVRLRFKTKAGFNFHQKALKENPEIRSWAERKSFLDADIPAGYVP
jgi:glycosyltransferase involved in cell wall biosynthesis